MAESSFEKQKKTSKSDFQYFFSIAIFIGKNSLAMVTLTIFWPLHRTIIFVVIYSCSIQQRCLFLCFKKLAQIVSVVVSDKKIGLYCTTLCDIISIASTYINRIRPKIKSVWKKTTLSQTLKVTLFHIQVDNNDKLKQTKKTIYIIFVLRNKT